MPGVGSGKWHTGKHQHKKRTLGVLAADFFAAAVAATVAVNSKQIL
jgi:hypothetical protein